MEKSKCCGVGQYYSSRLKDSACLTCGELFVPSQNLKVSSCCGAKKMTTKMYKGEKSWCFNCGKPFLPTQEPMEWGSSLEKVSGYKFASWTSQKEIKQFISELIKQAEERAREKDYLEGYNFAREEIKLSYELFPELSAKELLEMGKIITNQ